MRLLAKMFLEFVIFSYSKVLFVYFIYVFLVSWFHVDLYFPLLFMEKTD